MKCPRCGWDGMEELTHHGDEVELYSCDHCLTGWWVLQYYPGYKLKLQSSDEGKHSVNNWCDEGKHVGIPTHFTNPDRTPVIHCTVCGKQLQSSTPTANEMK